MNRAKIDLALKLNAMMLEAVSVHGNPSSSSSPINTK